MMKAMVATLLALLAAAPLAGQERRSKWPAPPTPTVDLFSVRASGDDAPCPPDPEPCWRGSHSREERRKQILFVTGGAMLAVLAAQVYCGSSAERTEEGGDCFGSGGIYVSLTGAAGGALVGYVASLMFRVNVAYAPAPSADLVMVRIPIRFGR